MAAGKCTKPAGGVPGAVAPAEYAESDQLTKGRANLAGHTSELLAHFEQVTRLFGRKLRRAGCYTP